MWLLKPWHDLSIWERGVKAVLFMLDISLLVAALCDLRRRPVEQLRGSRSLWFGLLFVDYLGPVAYYVLGRRRPNGVGPYALSNMTSRT